MDKELLEESIKSVERAINDAKENKRKAEQHIEEATLILDVFQKEMEKLNAPSSSN